METKISGRSKELVINTSGATILIGDRINPTGRKKLTSALLAGNMDIVRKDAMEQVSAGADVLDINVGASGVDEILILPAAVQAVMDVADIPLSLDSKNAKAIEVALKVYKGKPIINSVSGEEKSLAEVLPLVKQYGAAVIALTIDDRGIPTEVSKRLSVADKIIDKAVVLGIPLEDIIVDCLALTLATDSQAAYVTLETIRMVKDKFRVNQTLGASNISQGLPDKDILNNAFLTLAIQAGVTCPYVHVELVRPTVLATDLLLGRDNYGLRYIRAYRQRQTSITTK